MSNEASRNTQTNNAPPPTNQKIYYSPSKVGLFVGIVGFFIVSFLSFGGSCCATVFLALGVGAISGWLTANYSNLGIWDSASDFGGKAGRIAGVFVLLGVIAGASLPILLFKMGGALGAFPSDAVVGVADMTSEFIKQGIINGIIGLIITWITASTVASRVYENIQRNKPS